MAITGISLNQPLAASGPARTYFFNGRLLSAEDLRREQVLREAGQRGLARLLGCGIARGLGVAWSAGSSELTVSAGLGVTAAGDVIETGDFTLDLAAARLAGPAGGFADCKSAFGDGAAAAGLYLLVLTPDSIADGRAPTLLGDVGACNRNVELPAVRAHLVPLRAPEGASANDLRNRVAVALLAPATRKLGWIPASMAPTLAASDLPLAVLRLALSAQVEWADPEAARRNLAPAPDAAADALWPRAGRVEMEAFARQFAAQLRGSGALPAARAADSPPESDDYALLPPVVLLDAPTRARWQAVFGALGNLALPPGWPFSRERFVLALEGGLNDTPVARDEAQLQIMQLTPADRAGPQWLLRLRARDNPDAPLP
ncbi:hypothetical protein [Massilia sp. S19_KUP03_FR1]|uniref:hypothetical protein n=1 Tax=Massilia sp. S19_KUP03_FR1 TaxID=3025503 RepID=UPI002FCDAE8F